jgi:predicted nuclease of predicted toxin-antitoxin system
VSAGRPPLRLLIDEDLSPTVAQTLRETDGLDAVAVRDRGKLAATDREVMELAYAESRILVTANVADFASLAAARELHPGIVLLVEGDLLRGEQLAVTRHAIALIEVEAEAGRDMVNRVLRIALDGTHNFASLPERDGR